MRIISLPGFYEGDRLPWGMSWNADRDDNPFDKRTWAKANPSLRFLPALRQVIEVEAEEARKDSSLLPGFRALRLNQGTADHEIQSVLQAGTWERIELLPDGEPNRGVVFGSRSLVRARL